MLHSAILCIKSSKPQRNGLDWSVVGGLLFLFLFLCQASSRFTYFPDRAQVLLRIGLGWRVQSLGSLVVGVPFIIVTAATASSSCRGRRVTGFVTQPVIRISA